MHKPRAHYGSTDIIAKTMALPEDHPPHRLPTFPALERTAVLSFADTSTYSAVIATQAVPQTAEYAVMLRHPAFPLWLPLYRASASMYYSYPTSAISVINAGDTEDFNFDDLNLQRVNTPAHTHPMMLYQGKQFINLGFNALGGVGTNWNLMVTMEYNTGYPSPVYARGWWLDAGLNVRPFTIELSNPIAGAGDSGSRCCFTHYIDTSVIGVCLDGITVKGRTGGVSNINQIKYGVASTLPQAISAFDGLAAPTGQIVRLYPHVPPPEYLTTTIHFQAARATAVSVLFSNVTQVMAKEGTVSAARLSARRANAFDPTMWDGFSDVHPKDRYFGALENGIYGLTLPDANSELFTDSFVGDFVVDMDAIGYLYCFVFNDPSEATPTQLAVTLTRHIEFRTSSRLFPTNYSRYRLEEYHAAQMALAQLGCFTENPVHPAAVAAMVAKAAKAAWPYVQPYAVAAGKKLAGRAIEWVQGKLDGGGKVKGSMVQKQMVKPPQKRKPKAKPKRK